MNIPYMTRYAMTAQYSEDYDMCAEENGEYVQWDDLPEFARAVRREALEEAANLFARRDLDGIYNVSEMVAGEIRALITP